MVKVSILLIYDKESDQFLTSVVPFYKTYHWDYNLLMGGCSKYPLNVGGWYAIDSSEDWSIELGAPVKIAELWFDIFLYSVYLSTVNSYRNKPPVLYGNYLVHWSKCNERISKEAGDNVNESNMFADIARAYVFKEE